MVLAVAASLGAGAGGAGSGADADGGASSFSGGSEFLPLIVFEMKLSRLVGADDDSHFIVDFRF